ncbi:erythroblast NAD(P)(+)--arginine ADP-ribosyltransferase-like isoform X2 [Oenanthe melanoleuca]|nr:erythroblast NAD(P)(+)--arginine ADP-ribosyltransferase-like isoform X2 [Oenanthe melanoleuca]
MALLALTLALLAMTVATTAITVRPLDMAPDSFDDQYQNCSHAMMEELRTLKHSELQNNSLFAKVWPKAVHLWKFWGSPQYPLSSSAHTFALMAYTMDDLSEQFDDEVRVAGRSPQEHRDTFDYKTLHFLLTDAVATLRAAQGQKCHCVTWGVDDYKFNANVGDIVLFGQFMSSTLCENIFHHFRTTTVFKVQTCHGADIREFSRYPNVKGLLIPPFEKFNVTEVVEKGTSVEIHLNSIGTYSKYNCEWLKGGSVPTTPATSENSSWSPQPSQWPLRSSEP